MFVWLASVLAESTSVTRGGTDLGSVPCHGFPCSDVGVNENSLAHSGRSLLHDLASCSTRRLALSCFSFRYVLQHHLKLWFFSFYTSIWVGIVLLLLLLLTLIFIGQSKEWYFSGTPVNTALGIHHHSVIYITYIYHSTLKSVTLPVTGVMLGLRRLQSAALLLANMCCIVPLTLVLARWLPCVSSGVHVCLGQLFSASSVRAHHPSSWLQRGLWCSQSSGGLRFSNPGRHPWDVSAPGLGVAKVQDTLCELQWSRLCVSPRRSRDRQWGGGHLADTVTHSTQVTCYAK